MTAEVLTGRIIAAFLAKPLSSYRILDADGAEYDVETSKVLFLGERVRVTYAGDVVLDIHRHASRAGDPRPIAGEP